MIELYYKIKGALVQIVLIMLCFVGAKSCGTNYFNGNDPEKIAQYEQMIKDNSFVDATIQDEYTETSIGREAIKTYTFTYDYKINGSDYSIKKVTSSFPPQAQIKVFYLKENPSISTEDPKESIEEEKEKSSFTSLIMALIFGIVGLLLLASLILPLFSKKTKEIEHEE